jgi:hypothetical protein
MKKPPAKSTIEVQGTEVTVFNTQDGDFISLTDMLKAKDGGFFITDWLRNRNTVEFLGIRETVHNPRFNSGEFATIKCQVGLNSYKLSVKDRVETTGAIGLRASAGRHGGTYAHRDIAFEFGMWISPEFKIYLIKEILRLTEEFGRGIDSWSLRKMKPFYLAFPILDALPHPDVHRSRKGARALNVSAWILQSEPRDSRDTRKPRELEAWSPTPGE